MFGPIGNSAEAHLTIDVPQPSPSSIYMTMSRDDKRIALSLDDQVHVYELGNLYDLGARSIRKINLTDQINSYPNRGSPELTPDDKKWKTSVERRVEFSVDGKNLVIATCVEDQFAYIDLWDCDVEPWSIVAGGFGLTRLPSVCYSIFGLVVSVLGILLTIFSGHPMDILLVCFTTAFITRSS